MARPKLFTFAYSPAGQRVVGTLAHKEIEHDRVDVDITKQERPAEFNAASPFGKVPALVHDGRSIVESVVINEYLDEAWPKPAMMPADARGRAYARQWIVYFNRAVTDRDGEFVHVERDRERKAAICRRIFPDLVHLDRELAGRAAFFTGPDLSLVDMAIAPFTRILGIWAELVGDRQFAGYRNLRAYFDRLHRHPTLAKAVYTVPDEAYQGFFRAVLVDGMTVP
jgi:glutathione S-transferase